MISTKQFLTVAAVAAPLVFSAGVFAPAQAAPIAQGSSLNLSNPTTGTVNVVGTPAAPTGLTFSTLLGVQPVGISTSSGTFSGTSTIPSALTARIQNLTFTSGTTFSGVQNDFISGVRIGNLVVPSLANGFNALVNTSLVSFDLRNLVYNASNGDATFNGFFRSGTDVVAATGLFTSQLNAENPTTYSMTITAVPTPAALPALIGFGIGLMRKRKAAQLAETEA
jgi:hypothetical protein